MIPARSDLERLAHKYRTLAELRRDRQAGGAVPPPSFFKAIAGAFPGALQELDTLPLEVLDGRAEALEAAAAGREVEPWMTWLYGYHALYRAALRIKARLAREREVPAARAEALSADARRVAGVDIDADFVRAVARPPNGRITRVVLERLSTAHGVAATEIADTLFPRLRRGPRTAPR